MHAAQASGDYRGDKYASNFVVSSFIPSLYHFQSINTRDQHRNTDKVLYIDTPKSLQPLLRAYVDELAFLKNGVPRTASYRSRLTTSKYSSSAILPIAIGVFTP